MSILFALFVQDVSQSLQSYVATINTALVALGAIGIQDVVVTRLEDGPGRRGRLRTTISYTRTGTVNVGVAYFSANIPTNPGDVDAQAAAFFATNFRARSLFIRDIGDNLRGGLDSNAIMVLYATTPISNCGQNRARPMLVSALANIAAGASGYAQMVSATGPIPTVILNLVNRSSFTWPAGELGYAAPRVGSCIVDGYTTCCAGPAIPAAPVISPVGGTFTPPLTVTITDATGGATIHFTTDGTTPTAASPVYSGPFVINGPVTQIQAVAQVGSGPLSNITQALFVVSTTAATPVISPASGTVPSGQVITITDVTMGAVIHYTTDGSTPTAASPIYTGTFTIAATTTVKAIAIAPNFDNSAVATAAYTVVSVNVAAINAILGDGGAVNSMAISGNTLIVTGTFSQATDAAGTKTRNHIMGIDLSTGLITAWNPNPDGPVNRVAIDPSGRIWVTGSFFNIGGLARTGVARFSAAFVTDTFNAQANSSVQTVVFDTTNAYMCGGFSNAGGSARVKLAAFALSNDALQPALVTTLTGSVFDMCFMGTDLYVVGNLTAVNGSARAQGFGLTGATTLNAWSPTTNGAAAITNIRTDGVSLYVLGAFNTLRATSRLGAGALLPNNTLQAWNAHLDNVAGNSNGDALVILPTAAYLAGGFTFVGAVARNGFAKLDLATGALQAWDPNQSGTHSCVFYDPTSGMTFCGGTFASAALIFILPA